MGGGGEKDMIMERKRKFGFRRIFTVAVVRLYKVRLTLMIDQQG